MKQKKNKRNPRERVCERCGNDSYSCKKVFRCKYCGWLNGMGLEESNVEVTRGGIDEH